MHAGTLGEDIFPDNRFIRRNNHPGEALHDAAHLINLLLVDACHHSEVIVDHGHGARERGVAGALSKAVDGDVHSLHSCLQRTENVAGRQVVIIMGVEVEMQTRVAVGHALHVVERLRGRQDSQRVGQHEALHRQISDGIHELHEVIGRVLDAVAPVFEV